MSQLGLAQVNTSQYLMIKKDVQKKLGITVDLPIQGFIEYNNFKKFHLMFFDLIHVRDQHALTMLFEKLTTHNTVFIAFGGLHWHMWKDVLEQYFGAPKIYSYKEYLVDLQ